MFGKLKYLSMVLAFAAIGTVFTACDDDETAVDEWTSNYVYLQRFGLGVSNRVYNLSHSSLGVISSEEISVPLTVCLAQPYGRDVAVTLAASIEGDLPADDVALDGNVVIPAGETSVATTLSVNSDWSFVSRDAESYTIRVSVASVSPASDDLRISTKQGELTCTINKAEYCDILPNEVPDGSRITDYTGWSVRSCYDESLDGPWSNVQDAFIDGDTGGNSYVWYSTPLLSVRIDMGESRSISGLEYYSFYDASTYSFTRCKLFTSDDGELWTERTPKEGLEMGALRNTQYLKFISPIETRYVIWQMFGSAVLCSEIYVYRK